MKNTETSPNVSAPMDGKAIDRRSVMVGFGLAAGAAFSYFNMPRASATPITKSRFERMIPETVGGWSSRKSAELVLPAEDDQQDKLYENLETRIYEGDGLPSMMLLIGYSSIQQNDVHVHRPEVCYPAAGFPIVESKPAEIDFGPKKVYARELVADRGGLKERILYWVRVGEKFPIGWSEQRLVMAISNAKGVTPDGLLFRVSTIEEAGQSSPQALEDFTKAFVAVSPRSFRESVLF